MSGIRKSVKDLSKVFTSVEQAVEKNQEIIHEIRRSTSTRGVSPKIKEMLEKEKQRLNEQTDHDSRVRRLKKRGSEIVERRMSGTFVLGSDGSFENMQEELDGEKFNINLEEEKEEPKVLDIPKLPEEVPPQPTPKHVEPVVEEPPKHVEEPPKVDVPITTKQQVVEEPPKHVEEPPKHVEEPPKHVEEPPKVVQVPRPVEPEVVKVVKREPPQPEPKVVEPEVVKVVEEPPITTKQHVVEEPPKRVEEPPKRVEEPPKVVQVPRPVEPEVVKVVKREPPQPEPKVVEPVKQQPLVREEVPITTTKQQPESPKPKWRPDRPKQQRTYSQKILPSPQVTPKTEPEIVREEPKTKKTINEQPVEISEENNLKNMESINMITQTNDIDTIEINSDSDLANYIIQSINKAFEPFWEEYLKKFDPIKFTSSGKLGWDSHDDTPRRMVAREPINRMKNIECIHLSRLPFTTGVTDLILEKVSEKISEVSRQLIRSGVRKHIRLMLQDFIYRN